MEYSSILWIFIRDSLNYILIFHIAIFIKEYDLGAKIFSLTIYIVPVSFHVYRI